MDNLIDDIVIYIVTDFLDIQSIYTLISVSKKFANYKIVSIVQKKITNEKNKLINEILGSDGIELTNIINSLSPNTKNLLIPTNPNKMVLKLIKVLKILQTNYKRCCFYDIIGSSLGEYINQTDFHIMVVNPLFLEGQIIQHVDTILIYNCGNIRTRTQIIHKATHHNSGNIQCIDIGLKEIDRRKINMLKSIAYMNNDTIDDRFFY